MAIHLNRAFHGWEHRFLWNREILAESLESCGFEELEWCRYRESRYEIFRGIERHETYEDSPDLPHVLIVEAARGPARPRAVGRPAGPDRARLPRPPQGLTARPRGATVCRPRPAGPILGVCTDELYDGSHRNGWETVPGRPR